MSTLSSRLLVLATGLFAVQTAAAKLNVGDPAPKIQVASWVQGEPVKAFEGDKVYIVEFWATWCGPCVQAIPHLNETYKTLKDKGLVVIGQNLGEDSATATKFVKSMAGKMTYRVTVDDPTDGGFMAKNWLAAAGQNGIPCAFVVSKQGKIAYIGHPMSLKESQLESLLAEPSTKVLGADATVATAPSAKASQLASRAAALIRADKLDEAEAAIAELQPALTANFTYIGGLLELQLLLARKQADDAVQLSAMLCDDFSKQPIVLSAVASSLVSRSDATPALMDAAGKIATPISAAAGIGQSSSLETLARIAFLKGDKVSAVELQTKAVSLASKEAENAAKAALNSYQ
jgi:thiol-disulfide isomerase/thioredoxin